MDEQVEQLRAKLKALWDIRDNLKDDWSRNFVRDNLKRNFYSARVVAHVEKMFDTYLKGGKTDHANDNGVVQCGRISAYKSAAGWQVYMDMKAIGMTVTKRDAEVIVPWMGRAVESIEEIVVKPKPELPAQDEGEER